MNERERVETDLLTIIREGQNLTEGYVEVRPGIRIKAGREREFSRLCDNYYEREFNQIIENDTDTITPVYETLTKLVKTETEDYYMAKASDFVRETKEEIEKFRNLVKSYNTVDNAYRLTVKNLNDLYLKRENNSEWQQRVDELNNEVKRLTENSTILIEQINANRVHVNNTLIKYAEEQMEAIRDRFLNTSQAADKAPAMDHNVILASDIEEYNSLYRLTLVLKHANTIEDFSKLECLNDAMFVTEDQRAVLNNTILPNIKFLNYVRKDGQFIKTNNSFIAKIQKAMNILEKQKGNLRTNNGLFLTKEAQEEYDIYLEMLKILHKVNDGTANLSYVWDKAYVFDEDRAKFIHLLNKSNVFRKFNPDIVRKEQNTKLIEELYSYLDELASKVTSYTGVANLPIKSTNSVGDRAWVVIDQDFDEANRIVEIINLLLKQNKDLEPVFGIANVNSEDMPMFRRLINSTRKYGDVVPRIPENDAEIANIKAEVTELFKRAKQTENAVLASNGKVLESDEKLYTLFQVKYSYLEDAKASNNLVPIDGVLIDRMYANKYHEICEEIKTLLNKPVEDIKVTTEEVTSKNYKATDGEVLDEADVNTNAPQESSIPLEVGEVIDFSANNKKIDELKAELAKLSAKSSHNELERKMFDLLCSQIEILSKAKSSTSVIGDALKFVDEADKDKYLENALDLDEIAKKINEATDNKQKNTSAKSTKEDGYVPVDPSKGMVPYVEPQRGFDTSDNVIDFSENDRKIAELREEMIKLEPRKDTDELAREIYNLLSKQVEVLEKAKNSENVIDMQGLKFASEEDKNNYLSAQANLDDILKKLNANSSVKKKKGKIRKKITAIRDYIGDKLFNNKIGNFISNHKALIKLLVAAGIGLTAVTLAFPHLIPTIIFACSCNAAKYTAISSWLNMISSAIAPFAGISFVPGVGAINLGVSANLVGTALVNALANVGLVSVGAVMVYKGIKQYNNRDMEEHLKDPNVKTIVQKILDLFDKLKLKDIERNPDLSQTHLINSQIEYEANKENLSGEGLTEEEILAKLPKEDSKIQEQSLGISSDVSQISVMEEKAERGRKFQEELIRKRTQAQLEQAKKMAAEEGIAVDEALKKIQDRAKDSIKFHDRGAKVISYTEIPNVESIEAAKRAAQLEDFKEQEERKIMQEAASIGTLDDGVPVIEVPNMGEVINGLGGSTQTYDKLSQEEIERLLHAEPVIGVQPSFQENEAKLLEEQIAAKEQEAKKFQDLLNLTSSEEHKIAYQNALDKANREIDALKEQRGRGL